MAARLRLELDSQVNLGDLELFLKRAHQAGLNPGDYVELIHDGDLIALQTLDLHFTRTELP